MSRRLPLLCALLGGLLTAGTVPPFGWWPLAFPGLALLALAVADAGPRTRVRLGAVFGLGLYVPSLWWMTQFSLPGGIVVALIETFFTAVAMLVVRPGRTWATWCSVPVAVVLADSLRSLWPFGGLPLGGIDLGQADGPLAPLVAFGGRLLLVGMCAVGGAALAAAWRARRLTPAVAGLAAAAVLAPVLARVLPDGTHADGTLRIAVVQGGGPRGLRASPENAERTYQAHLAAAAGVRDPVDLIVWPEDVVDVERLDGSPVADVLAGIARTHQATLVVGIVEDEGTKHFLNRAVAWGPDGQIVGRFDKVRRVPYGEFFWGRSVIERLGLASLPSRDALPGTGPGILRTPAGDLAVAISYEAFFDDRVRGGVRAGGRVVVIPTNASSYITAHVPTQQVAAARLRARESGRWVLQAAPTGFSGVFDHRGRLLERTTLGEPAVVQRTVGLRMGLTPYARWNDVPALALATVMLGLCQRGRRRGDRSADPDASRPVPDDAAFDPFGATDTIDPPARQGLVHRAAPDLTAG